jgi:Ca-activated chloride channel family protein
VRVGIQGQRIDASQRADSVLTFVIDISGSMAQPNRLPLVKQALRLLVGELRESDKVAIVVYGGQAATVLDHTSAANRDQILRAIDSLENQGSTNAEAGLRMGYELAAQHFTAGASNRVILCSDGVANVGATGPDEIRQAIRDYTAQGIYLTTVGFGMGDYNDYLMEQLADDGNGNYAYVDTLDAARRIFVENLTGTLQVIAKDAKIQVDFNPVVVDSYRLLGYENRDVADADFRNDRVDAGEVGAGHSVTALYEVVPTGQGRGTALTVRVRYAAPQGGEIHEIEQVFATSEFGTQFEAAAPSLQLAVAVAGFAEQLRGSAYAEDHTLADVLAIAQHVAPKLANDSDVQEFVGLVERATGLRG